MEYTNYLVKADGGSLRTEIDSRELIPLGKLDDEVAAFKKFLTTPIDELHNKDSHVFYTETFCRTDDDEEDYPYTYSKCIIKHQKTNEYFARASQDCVASISLTGADRELFEFRSQNALHKVKADTELTLKPDFSQDPDQSAYIWLKTTSTDKPQNLVKLAKTIAAIEVERYMGVPQDPKELGYFTHYLLNDIFSRYNNTGRTSIDNFKEVLHDLVESYIPNPKSQALKDINTQLEQERLSYIEPNYLRFKHHMDGDSSYVKAVEDNVVTTDRKEIDERKALEDSIKPKIWFKTPEAAAVFKDEIRGQLSDGLWEASSCNWRFWNNLEVCIDPTGVKYGIETNLTQRNDENFNLHRLLEYVSNRICITANLARAGVDIPAIDPIAVDAAISGGSSWLSISDDRRVDALSQLGLPYDAVPAQAKERYKKLEYYTRDTVGKVLDEITGAMRKDVLPYPDVDINKNPKELTSDEHDKLNKFFSRLDYRHLQGVTNTEIAQALKYAELLMFHPKDQMFALETTGKMIDSAKRDLGELQKELSGIKVLNDPNKASIFFSQVHLDKVTSATPGANEFIAFMTQKCPETELTISPKSLSGVLSTRGTGLLQIKDTNLTNCKIPIEQVSHPELTNNVAFSEDTTRSWKKPVVASISKDLIKKYKPKGQEDLDTLISVASNISEENYPMRAYTAFKLSIATPDIRTPKDVLDRYNSQIECTRNFKAPEL